jgi:hypothetical protein
MRTNFDKDRDLDRLRGIYLRFWNFLYFVEILLWKHPN